MVVCDARDKYQNSGPGFPVLSTSVYYYIASGNIDAAMAKMNYGDC